MKTTRDDTRILQFCPSSHRPVELLELCDALGIPEEIPPHSLDLVPSSWENNKPVNIRLRLTKCTGNFVEVEGIPSMHASILGKSLGSKGKLFSDAPLDLSDSQMDEQAIIQVMHQTVREFFLRSHRSVISSHFQSVSARPARKMIAKACIRYLNLLYKELGNKFEDVLGASSLNWNSEGIDGLVQYLNSRPLIKHSLKYLALLKGDVNIDLDILKLFPKLTTIIQNCPSSLQSCLLGRRTDFSTVQELNCLLGIAVEKGYIVAAGNLLAVGAE